MRWWRWVMVALAGACGEPGHLEIKEGERCGDVRSQCFDGTTVLVCIDRKWETYDCEALCGDREEELLGCYLRLDSGFCLCEESEIEPCDSSLDRECTGPDTLARCEEGIRTEESCTESCAAREPPLASAGCEVGEYFDSCECTHEGLPCDSDAPPVCDGSRSIATCEDGLWVVESCVGPCPEEESARCIPFEGEGAECGCVE